MSDQTGWKDAAVSLIVQLWLGFNLIWWETYIHIFISHLNFISANPLWINLRFACIFSLHCSFPCLLVRLYAKNYVFKKLQGTICFYKILHFWQAITLSHFFKKCYIYIIFRLYFFFMLRYIICLCCKIFGKQTHKIPPPTHNTLISARQWATGCWFPEVWNFLPVLILAVKQHTHFFLLPTQTILLPPKHCDLIPLSYCLFLWLKVRHTVHSVLQTLHTFK